MLICRVALGDHVSFAAVEGITDEGKVGVDTSVTLIEAHPFGDITLADRQVSANRVRFLPPMLPSKIVAVGKNYADHAVEMGGQVPAEPMLFFKPNTSVIGPGSPIVLPATSAQVEMEAELAIVIGRMCRHVPAESAADVILGYTVANDVTARDHQRSDGQWARAKGYDTFCPLGPWINTDLDPNNAVLWGAINGEQTQRANTSSMVNNVAELVEFVSGVMTLLPGDVILTGTPAGVTALADGDEVTVAVDGIGQLSNPVAVDNGASPWR